MHGNEDMVNMLSSHQITSTENGSPDSYMDPYDDYTQVEESMETEEIEAMLYSQLYFEPHDTGETIQFGATTDYSIRIEEEDADKCENINSLAAMVNFSGRSFMSSSGVTPERNEIEMQPVVKKSKTNKQARSAIKNNSKVENQQKKKGKSKEVVLVLSDSSGNDEEQLKALKKTGKTGGKCFSKRGADKFDPMPLKKLKKTESDIVIVDSCSDLYTESDSDDYVFDSLSDNVDDFDLNLNVKGLWKSCRNPARNKTPDLHAISLQAWDGDPPLTIEEVHQLLKGSCWKINDDDKYGLMRSYGQKNITCNNCNEKGHYARECPKPKKIPKCALCGEEGHMHWRCPNGLCYNCDLPGHSSKLCTAPRKSHRIICNRCGFPGHIQTTCPEHWRQYHLTTEPGPLQVSEQKENKAVFCYNCGKKGHYGYECNEDKINEYLQPWSPFVTYYSKSEHKHKKVKVKSKSKHRKKVSKDKMEIPFKKSVSLTVKSQGKMWTSKEQKTKSTNKQEKNENKKNKIEWPSVPQFFKNPIEKLNLKHQKKKSNQTKKKVFDEELEYFPRNKSHPENTNKKDTGNASKREKCHKKLKSLNKTKTKKIKKSVFVYTQDNSNKVSEKHSFKGQQCAKPVKKRIAKCVHTIFDSPNLSFGKTSKNQDKNNKPKDDRKVNMNKRGFKMTIYN